MAASDDNDEVGSGSSKASRQAKPKSKTSTENVAGETKKKELINGDSRSETKTGASKNSKKQKNRTSKSGKVNRDAGANADDTIQKVQVKQRSSSTLLNTGSSLVAAGADAVSVASVVAASAAEDQQGFAGYYGMMIETKRVEEFCRSLALEKRYIASLHRAFKREEQLGTGEITTGEFFTMLNEKPRQLTNGLFEHVGLPRETRRLRFDDFVYCVATIATWSKAELLHYAFAQFDVDESGVMDGHELRAFCEGLKSDSSFYFSKNVNTARQKLASRDRQPHQYTDKTGKLIIDIDADANTLVDLTDLAKGSEEFQVAFYPLMQFQQNARECALGDRFWAGLTHRKQQVEGVVRYMQLHKGKLPPVSLVKRLVAYLMPFSNAHAELLVHELAVVKFAKDQRILQEQAQVRAQVEALALTNIQEENQA